MQTFTHNIKIGLQHTDAAGILFYSQIFTLAYQAYDAWLESLGVSVAWIIQQSDFLLPYVHAEADFMAPMTVGQTVKIMLSVEKVGQTSITLSYQFWTGDDLVARAKTVHVAVSKKTKEKIDLPEVLKNALA